MTDTFSNAHEAIEADIPQAKKPGKQTIKNRMNKDLSKAIPSYCEDIPLDEIFAIVERHGGLVVDEAGEKWTGLLCGEQGNAIMRIAQVNMFLNLTWYKMPSGKWEIVVYVA